MVLGINPDPTAASLQLGGLFISILSLVKGVVTRMNRKDASFIQSLKMTSFVLPHTMARVVGFSVIAAFLKYLTLIPILLLSLVNFIILVLARRRAQGGIDPLSQMLPCILISLCTPFTWNPLKPHERSYLRHSLLTTNLTLLVCLLVIAIVPSETIVTHPAFEHLRFDTLSEEDTGAFLKPNLSRKHNIQILLFQLLN